MFKRIILILALICMIVLPVFGQSGNYTVSGYFYLPLYGAYGMDEYNEYNLYMQKADTQIEANKNAIADIDTSAYYLKTEINTQAKVETIWDVSLVNDGDLDLYYLKTEIDTQGELETIWGDTLMNDLVDDTTPQLGGDLDAQANHIGFTQQTITYNVTTTTVDWGAGNKATVTLTGNVGTMAFTNPAKPSNLLLKIVQDATGSRVVTAWDADIKWAGGTKPTLTTTANGIDIASFYWDGTNYFGVASLAFATP